MQRLRPNVGAGASPQLVLTVASSNSGWVHDDDDELHLFKLVLYIC